MILKEEFLNLIKRIHSLCIAYNTDISAQKITVQVLKKIL